MRDLRDDALHLASFGWHIFPLHSPDGDRCDCRRTDCPSPSKHPRTQHGLKDATSSLDQVLKWWEMWPHANIGVATGAASGIVVIDVDPRHAGDETLNQLIAEHGQFPYLPWCTTGGGGYHYYFRHPGAGVRIPNSANTIGAGVDVRGDGGYVVAPPSVHQTGASYAWEKGYEPGETCQPAELPDWLLTVIQAAPRGSDGPYAAAPDVPEDVAPGSRNSTLASLGGSLRNRGIGQQAIHNALMAINAGWSQPLERTEVAQIAASVSRYEPQIEVQIVNDVGAARRTVKPDIAGITPYKASLLRDLELPATRWAVPELLPEGLGLLAGAIKFGKSWLALNIAIAIAEGGIALGEIPVVDGDVLYIALEDSRRRMQSRLQRVLGDEPYPDRMEIIDTQHRFPRADAGGVAFIDDWLGRHPQARLVVVDTLQRFRGSGSGKRNASAYAEDYLEMEPLHEMANRHGVAILFLHHINKALHEDWVDKISGTAGIGGAADTLIGLMRPRGQEGQRDGAMLRVTGRDVQEQDYALHFDGQCGRWSILGDAGDVKAQHESDALLQAIWRLRQTGQRLFKAADVTDALAPRKPTTIRSMLHRAWERGSLVRVSDGIYMLPEDAQNNPPVAGAFTVDATPATPPEKALHVAGVARVAGVAQNSDVDTNRPPTEAPNTPHNAQSVAEGSVAQGVAPGVAEPPKPPPGATPTGGPVPPPMACSGCGETAWSLRMGNRYMCDNCNPYMREVIRI